MLKKDSIHLANQEAFQQIEYLLLSELLNSMRQEQQFMSTLALTMAA
jgi:hypothetical protein